MSAAQPSYEIDNWETEVLPKVSKDADVIITLRTREFIVANQSKLFRVLSRINKVLIVFGTLALLAMIGLSIVLSVVMLNNLQVLQVMQNQRLKP